MSKAFEYRLKGDVADTINKAILVARENGVAMSGDVQTGQFTGHGIVGQYQVLEDKLAVTIEKKPLVMPWSLIETTLNKFFA